MTQEACLAAIARFRAACEREPIVLAAFLGGSFAAGTAREDSDVDVYVISTEEDYAGALGRGGSTSSGRWASPSSSRITRTSSGSASTSSTSSSQTG